jgi:hypothetical protein
MSDLIVTTKGTEEAVRGLWSLLEPVFNSLFLALSFHHLPTEHLIIAVCDEEEELTLS